MNIKPDQFYYQNHTAAFFKNPAEFYQVKKMKLLQTHHRDGLFKLYLGSDILKAKQALKDLEPLANKPLDTNVKDRSVEVVRRGAKSLLRDLFDLQLIGLVKMARTLHHTPEDVMRAYKQALTKVD